MEQDGTLARLFEQFSNSATQCSALNVETDEEENNKLTLTDMLGVFVIHIGVLIIGTCLYSFFQCGTEGQKRVRTRMSFDKIGKVVPNAPVTDFNCSNIVPDADELPPGLQAYLATNFSKLS